jgi:hypothetical protein
MALLVMVAMMMLVARPADAAKVVIAPSKTECVSATFPAEHFQVRPAKHWRARERQRETSWAAKRAPLRRQTAAALSGPLPPPRRQHTGGRRLNPFSPFPPHSSSKPLLPSKKQVTGGARVEGVATAASRNAHYVPSVTARLFSPAGDQIWTSLINTETHFNIAATGPGAYKIW